jgi:hypothetical protein
LKITSGVGDGSKFAPNSPLSRQQMAAMIVNTLRACYPSILIDTIGQGAFMDQKQFAAYAVESAKFLTKYNISVGDGKGSFIPAANCTRQEAITFLVKAYDTRNNYISFREVETTVKDGVKIDKTDYPFEPDDAVLGEWITVDYVKDPMLFDPDKKQAQRLYYYSIIFYSNGICDKTTYYDGDWVSVETLRKTPSDTWTKGLVISDDATALQSSRYYIAKVKNKEYLFLEFKNGDYTFRNATPSYYVFTRE